MAWAVAIRLVRLAHQAPGTGVLAAFAFEVHSNLRKIGAPLWRTRVIGRFSSEYIIMRFFYQTNPSLSIPAGLAERIQEEVT
jgi:hypothetical protein